MTLLRWAIVAAGFTAIVGALPVEARVDVVQTTSPALAPGSTFAWTSMNAVGMGMHDPAIANEITAERLRAATETALAAKGYRQVENPAEADLLLVYTILMEPESTGRLTSDAANCGIPVCGPAQDYSLATHHYTQGTLVLDLIERQTGRMVWRATSKNRVTGKDVSEKKLTALLREMTKSLPLR